MITVVGLGFVGLTTALGFAQVGFRVFGYDNSEGHRQRLLAGEVPFFEPHLPETLARHSGKRFQITASLEEAVRRSSIVFFCVGTPESDDGSAALGHLDTAIAETLRFCDPSAFKVLIVKSTVPPSTTSRHVVPFVQAQGFVIGETIGVANNPEFLREGHAWQDFIRPDRIVVGVSDERTSEVVADLYKPFAAPLYRVTLNTAEFVKYLSNTLLATLISFANEMSIVADKIGDIQVPDAFRILHQDKRWFGDPANMTTYVYPGCGFGGYCLPKDTAALGAKSAETGYVALLLRDVLAVNERIKRHHVERIAGVASTEETIGIAGLSFKPGSDDVRMTPAKDIIELLMAKGYRKILAYDPMAIETFRREHTLPVDYAGSLDELLDRADVVVVTTAWPEFSRSKRLRTHARLYDLRYCLSGFSSAPDQQLSQAYAY